MGSLASRPKVPDVQPVSPVQYVYVPAATTAAPVVPTTPIDTPDTPTDEDVQASTRAANLLERRRGRLGTVLTSFRGLLNDTMSGARKTLLGE